MAVVSDSTLYKEHIAPSYVSSSGYYGYVPPLPPLVNYGVVQNQRINERVVVGGGSGGGGANDQTTFYNDDWTTMLHRDRNNHNNDGRNGSAMETDDDDVVGTFHSDEYVGVSRCQNNRCVIPELVGRDEAGGNFAVHRVSAIYRLSDQNGDSNLRGNRKRNSAGDPAYLIVGNNQGLTKKSRQETVVTATLSMLREIEESVDRPRCIMSRQHQ